MNRDRSFGRLLKDYERLAGDEATAIREGNFPALAPLQEKKSLILQELIQLRDCPEIDTGTPEMQARLNTLKKADLHNQALLERAMSKLQEEVKMLKAATLRLRSIENVYSASATRQEDAAVFFAQV